MSLKKFFRSQKDTIDNIKSLNFNKFISSNTGLKYENEGIHNLISSMYYKNAAIRVVQLKSLDLNSDIFSYAVALKLRDRMNKTVSILRKAILQMVKIPPLHTLIIFDDYVQIINKDNIVKVIKQQAVSGVRFEATGRLTRRLTAMRSIFKYKYEGSLKNIRSSLNKKPSKVLRGYVKSNAQYTEVNTKTRNGSFTLKCWISSHNLNPLFLSTVILSENLFMRYSPFRLDITYFISILLGTLVVILKTPIISVLFLIGLFLNISCYFILDFLVLDVYDLVDLFVPTFVLRLETGGTNKDVMFKYLRSRNTTSERNIFSSNRENIPFFDVLFACFSVIICSSLYLMI
ncbi:hypothetical protein [Streptomyces fungicidicus]|uniref:hypothetical protein n=1 Tax=Streptomyces fungicidicus TaxID=68203 RepID=UPI003D736958